MNDTKRIGGWLFLVGLQIAATILIALRSLKIYIGFFNSSEWSNISNMQDSNFYKALFIYETALYAFLVIGGLFMLYAFVSKKRRFRDFYSLFMLLCILGYLVSYLIASEIEALPERKTLELERTLLSYIVWSAIWIFYLYKAKRPQITFTN